MEKANKTPLYKELREKISKENNETYYPIMDQKTIDKFSSNACIEYVALAVGNLHILADVLDRILASMALERVERFDLVQDAKDAISKIS